MNNKNHKDFSVKKLRLKILSPMCTPTFSTKEQPSAGDAGEGLSKSLSRNHVSVEGISQGPHPLRTTPKKSRSSSAVYRRDNPLPNESV